ncbi:hypothetical protein [Stackebrandtia nassauensis]|uniref:Uncharacterized protein n=1 Tax=Stackebrandtia nassauensis (strain DSM 44728 / CIP 108903 / NRRL B-16338 / NBRC 102104 / LLR-40K-21) TaxID=446470 RepID=D3PTX4_STANL|nr:hypothetical protein [Stackebrandtia nassauensis]ADD39732.1 hypothetical protein Snas_0009 [Stackebrandtia nassauensis DSM 44728]
MSDKASEFITLMTAVKELLNEAGQQSNSAAGIADEAAELFAQGGNANSHTMMTQAAESARKVLTQVAGLVSTTDEAIAQAQQAKGNLHTSSSGSSGVREPVAKIGDPIEAPQGGPDDTSDHRAELKSADDDDEEMTRADRALRVMARNAGDVETVTKDIVQTASSMFRTYKEDKPGSGQPSRMATGQSEAQTQVPQPKISSDTPQGPSFEGMAVATVLGGVAAIQGIKALRSRQPKEK